LTGKTAKWTRVGWLFAPVLLMLAAAVFASQILDSAGPGQDFVVDNPQSPSPPTRFPVTINQPAGPPTIDTGKLDVMGRPILANCTTCHTTKVPNPRLNNGADLKDFHLGLTTNHGDRSCLSCHNPDDYNQLRLADGQPVMFKEVMTLCAQCHGPQYKDYQNGAHGGMTGYWDLTRGPRARNNCIDCHDPHAPQYPKFMPVLRPNDRFLRSESSENAHE
jgi:formate-dependent nitrite reductase cytochrome c552 subunit